MKIIYSEKYNFNIGKHPWNTAKYSQIKELLLQNNIINAANILTPEPIDEEMLTTVHPFSHINKIYNREFGQDEINALGLPLSEGFITASFLAAGGTLLACRNALINNVCVHLGGGWHHAFPSYASGFCLINDIAIALKVLLNEKKITNALIIDLDVHQGDATAKIFEKDQSVFTFSMHQKQLFPFYKQNSDLDIELENGISDQAYLSKLKDNLHKILYRENQYDLIIYQAGVDIYSLDPLSDLDISMESVLARDKMVFEHIKKAKIPVAVTLGGGYSKDVVALHANTVKVFCK